MTNEDAKERDKGRRRITIADVAREAGVSRATVSFVLSNDPHQTISAATQEKVRQTARRLEYQSFAPARMLRTGRSSIVLLVLDTINVAPIYAYVVEPLAKALNEHGLNLLWQIGINPDAEQAHPVSDLVPAVVVSLVEEPNSVSDEFLQRFGVPIVSANPQMAEQLQSIARLQATYLLDKGHRQLAFAASSNRSVWQEMHLQTIAQVCSEYRVAAPVSIMLPERRAAVRTLLTTFLAEHPSLGAICAADDETALALLAALADLDIAVPERIAVIGSGNISFAAVSVPSLTTVSIADPVAYIDSILQNVLAAMRREPLDETRHFPYRVVPRKSA